MRKTSLVFLGIAAGVILVAGSGCGDDAETDGSGGSTSSTTTGATTTTTGATTTTTGAGGGGGEAPAPTCEAYCTTVMASCAGADGQYGSMESCLGACMGFDIGVAGETAGNTVGCRTYHAEAAAAAPAMHCTHAGPGGADVCGTNCEGFCAIAAMACMGANEQYADDAACMADCATFADTEPYDISDTGSNTLACRLYHLSVAATDAASATTHCGHITAASPVCVN